MGASPMLLSEAEIHGLVDGKLDSDRRADVLRRLAASPGDRALVDAWQEQNELIRAAFGDIEREPLPASLDLAPPRLRCVPAGDTGLLPPVSFDPTFSKRHRLAAGLATVVLMTIGLGGSWALMLASGRDRAVTGPVLRDTIDTTLAERTANALDLDTRSTSRMASPPENALGGSPPTTTIPDLWPVGFSLTRAEADASGPASLTFHYRNAGAERVVIGAARDPKDGMATPPARLGATFGWHHRGTAYAVAGTVAPERLREIANLLQGDDSDE